MKLTTVILASALLGWMSPRAHSAVTVYGVVTGTASGTDPANGRPLGAASASYAGVGIGSTISVTLDFPSVGAGTVLGFGGVGFAGTLYPLQVTLSGGGTAIHPLGFGITVSSAKFVGGVLGQPDLVMAFGSVGDTGSLSAVFTSSLEFESPDGSAFADYSGATDIRDHAEAALAAHRFTGGLLVLVDNVQGFGTPTHQWGYTFTLIPEPLTAVQGAGGLSVIAWLRRRRSVVR